jgi:VWFA-related protein
MFRETFLRPEVALVAGGTLVALCVGPRLSAVNAQTATFRSAVELIRIDAVVVDTKGVPIRGLTSKDFTVVVDGTPRPIVAFDAIDLPVDRGTKLGEAGWIHSAPRDVVTNDIEDRRLFLIVIDDAVMPPNPAAVARAKSIAHDVVSRLGTDDYAAVVFTMSSQKSQSFTTDRARLATTIDSTSYGFKSVPPRPGDVVYDVGSARTLANVVSALRSAPQARKTLAFISAGVSFRPSTLAPMMSSVGGANPLSSGEPARLILNELNTLFREAARSHVNVYTFDVNDLRDDNLMTDERDYLRTVAENTGGRATIANEDPAQGVLQMFRESSLYYLLGVTPETSGAARYRVEVRTTRPDARVLARKVFDRTRSGTPASAEADPLALSIAGVLPADGLPMRATATVLPGPSRGVAIVAIVIGLNQPAERLQGARAQMTARVDAYDAHGTFRGATKLDAQLRLNPTASVRAQYELLAKLPLKPGDYQLRIAASASQLKLRGTVFLDIDVPDFSRGGVIVAPLVLSASPAPPAAPANAFAGLLPMVPTSHRTFRASDHVAILARIVAGGQEPVVHVALEASVIDTRNRRVFVQSDTITIDGRHPQRYHDYTIELPVEGLAVDDYLVTVKATTPTGAQEKTLRFSRR